MSRAWRLVPTNRIVPLVRGQLADELHRVLVQLHRLFEVDDVDLVALAEDVFRHLRIPVPRLVAEVDSGFQHLTHRDGHYLHSFQGWTTTRLWLERAAGCQAGRVRAP